MEDLDTVSPNGDRNPSPNPNPNPSPPHSPSGPCPAPPSPQQTLAASRKSERKRKIREFPEMSHPRKIQTIWSESDLIALLKAAKEFRERTGAEPRGPTMKEFFEEVKGLIGEHLDQEKVYNKMKRLKSKFLILGDSPPTGGHERALYELSAEVWRGSERDEKARADGEKDKNENHEEKEDLYAIEPIEKGPDMHTEKETEVYPFLTEALRDYYKANRNNFSEVSLERGIKQMDPSRAKELEKKWKKQVEADMRSHMKRHELIKEVYALLIDGVKGQVS